MEAIYFHTFPYTSDRAKEKVVSLAHLLTKYTGRIKHVVDFTETQLTLNKLFVPPEMMTLVMRRMMLRSGEVVAKQRYCGTNHRRKSWSSC